MIARGLRQLVGMALGIAGVVLSSWGLFHLVRQPSCGSDGSGTYGPPCPDDVVWWILALIGSAVVLLPLAIAVAGRRRDGGASLLFAPVFAVTPICLVAAVVVSLVGQSADPDTHWVGWMIAGIAGLFLLLSVRAAIAARRRARSASPGRGASGKIRTSGGPPVPPAPSKPAAARRSAQPVQAAPGDGSISQLAGQLQQIAQAKRAAVDDTLAQRLKRLDELLASGLISRAEHAKRRTEILDEI